MLVVGVAGGAGGTQPYATYETTVAADGPAHQYRFDDAPGSKTLADSAGSLAGTVSGITLGAAGPFTGAHAGSFGGSASASFASSPLAGDTAFAAEAWVDWSGGASYQQRIFYFGSSATNWLSLTPASSATNHPLTFEIRTTAGTIVSVTAPELSANAWEYVAVTESSSGVLTLYVNGKQVGQTTGATLTPSSLGSTSSNLLGKSQVSTDPLFKGSLSNVAFYAKALSASQVLAHYNAGEFPVNSSAPTISGTAKDGQTLTAASGAWTGVAPITYAYQWERCNTSGASCSNISGATASTYKATPADVGWTLRVSVTATNGAGSGSAVSAATATVAALGPANTAAPTISGSAKEGQLLTASTGTWTGTPPLSFAYQWQACNTTGGSCASITGATSSTYRLVSAQVGKKIKVVVAASNAGGSASATSAATATVTTGPPVNVTPPSITGTARDGQTLTASAGTWAGTATITYTYQWQSCNATGGSCVNISGATSSTFTLGPSNVGSTLQVVVTAKNSVGSASATSPISAVVAAVAPANTALPTISGTPKAGSPLSATTGSWSGTPPLSYAYQWQSCNSLGSGCVNIAGATGTSYTLQPSDVGNTVRVTITATNAAGSASTNSAVSAVVSAVAPANTAVPTVSGTAQDGQTLSASTGSWSGTPPFSYAYQWQSCNASGAACSNISGATSSTFALGPSSVGSTLRVTVTASNSAGSASGTSTATAVVTAVAPTSIAAPALSGTAQDGQTLSASTGSWSGTPPLSYAYQWQSCNASGASCSNISGATSSTLTLGPSNVGSTLRVAVTASNAAGSASSTSPATAVVSALAPANTAAPTVSGTPQDGQTLSASTGAWTGTPPLSYVYQWQTCNSSGGGCANISAATSSTYTVGPSNIGGTLRATVTASNAAGSASSTSAATAVVTAVAPTNSAPPVVSGTVQDGQTLSASTGSWSGTAPLSYAYQWQTCNASGGGCSNIAGATASALVLGPSNVGQTLRVAITASNAAGSALANSAPTAVVAPAPPVNTALPAISGTATDGQALSASPGSWSGTAPLNFTYQWQSCNASGASCSNMSGATASTFALGPSNVGGTVRVVVSASNPAGTASASSAASAVVTAAPPVNTGAPSISGTATDGQTLSAAVGSWSGTAPLSYAYQWQSCNAGGSGCANITGSTSSTYQLGPGDVGNTLRVVITTSNSAGSASATSAPTAAAAAASPLNATPPTISGTPTDGQTLSATTGSWTGTPTLTYSYQWQSCDASGAGCTNISGATAAAFVLGPPNVGTTLRVTVTASNSAGSAAATSAASAVVAAAPPANTVLPAVSGTATDGQTLSATAGTWSGTAPLSYAYQWQACSSGNSCSNISGATSSTLTLGPAEVGSTIVVVVSASNAAGSVAATSSPNGAVAPLAPANTTAPQISGSPEQGQTLTVSSGSWTGTPPLSYSYQWQRCDTSGANCSPIAAATSSSYQLGPGDVASTLRATVTATNTAGSTSASSPPSLPVAGLAPSSTSAPVISGSAQDGQTLTASPGSWSGTPPIGYAYQWQRCDTTGSNCVAVTGATTSSYQLTAGDVGSTLEVIVTASNAAGSVTQSSAPSATVTALAPANTTAPQVSGTAQDGQALTASTGTWSGTAPLSYAYQWQRCDASGGSCVNIAGATGSTYLLADADVGATVRVTVTASNAAGPGTGVSPATPAITGSTGAPTNSVPPTISGTVRDGQTLTVIPGTWSGTAPITYTYQWQSCDASGANCNPVAAATAPTYALSSTDVGTTLEVIVTASNANGSATATSPASGTVAALAPANTAGPTISGTPQVGQTLTAIRGSWSGSTPLSYAYQWESCDALGQTCAPIASATSATYTPAPGDLAATLRVQVSASNPAGTASATSYASAAVIAAETVSAPTVLSTPTITGLPQAGETLYAGAGTWSTAAPLTYAYQWQSCDNLGNNCTPITGATGQTYQATAADTGNTIALTVTATNSAGSATATSTPSSVVTAAPPLNTLAPAITGTAAVGQTLTVSDGTWISQTPLSYTYQWESCDPTGVTCVIIPAATDSTYTLAAGDASSTLGVIVTATNESGTSAYTAGLGTTVSGGAPTGPALTGAPTITGAAEDNQLLTANPGTWSANGTIAYAYQWESCDAQGNNCSILTNETNATYTTSDADVGNTLVVIVTATDTDGSTQTASAPTPVIAPTPPSGLTAPSIVGTAQAGQALFLDPGTWSGTSVNLQVQWQRCDAAGSNCADVPGATNDEYDPTGPDDGGTLVAVVTASNTLGTVTVATAPSGVIARAPTLSESSPPSISGAVVQGQTLTADPGSWTGGGTISYTYQWQSCDALGQNCTGIAGATSPTYTPGAGDVGATLAVSVTATDANGSLTDTSTATQPVATDAAPSETSPPSISGTPQAAATLSASTGTWAGPAVTSYAYQWESCDPTGSACVPIDGATSSTYTPTLGDVNTTLLVVVTATGTGGSASAYSSPVGPIGTVSLANTAIPTVAGVAQQGQTLTAGQGTWSSPAPLVYAYQWESCDTNGQNCAAITGATSGTYTPAAADIGTTLRVQVTAAVLFGNQPTISEVVESDPTTVVPAAPTPPNEASAPTISGQAISGQTLTARPGSWNGTQPVDYTYQWQRCDPQGDPCADIAGATANTYTAAQSDLGSTLAVVVTATNAAGAATATAYTSGAVIGPQPQNLGAPTISGQAVVGQPLTADTGSWTGLAPLTFSYQWQSCDPQGDPCANIAGATSTTYTPTSGDVGNVLAVVATATNPAGASSAIGYTSGPVDAPVAPSDAPPVITGTPLDGQTLTATPGTWSGPGPLTYAYAWQRCDTNASNCAPIANATANQYTLTDADLGATIIVTVTATNPYGSTIGTSTATPVIAAGPPVATPPLIQGSAIPGAQLSLGTLSAAGQGPITSSVQWQDCNSTATQCTDIQGATSDTYTTSESDVGYTIAAVITYTNAVGTTSVTSTVAMAITDAPPTLPAGGLTLNETEAQVGDTLTPTAWEGSTPMTATYQWQSCQTPTFGCAVQSSGGTYTTSGEDAGRYILLTATATNSLGTMTRSAAPVYVDTPSSAPAVGSPPQITGTAQDGQTLTASTGQWYGDPTGYSYQWKSCDPNYQTYVGAGYCSVIPGATGATYQPTIDDDSYQITVTVTATNANGSSTSTAPDTPQVLGVPPANIAAPSIGGQPIAGNRLSATTGDWTGTTNVNTSRSQYTFQWQTCDPQGDPCTNIPGATTSFYTPPVGEVGDSLQVAVTTYSPAPALYTTGQPASTTTLSAPTPAISAGSPPSNTSPPTISGAAQDGLTLSADPGNWAGTPTINYAAQWERCDPTGNNCTPIPNATSGNYTPTSADIGNTLVIVATATNAAGTAQATSSPTTVVQPPALPTATHGGPYIAANGSLFSGVTYDNPTVGQTLVAQGSWGGDPTTYSYQWLLCDPQLTDPTTGAPVCLPVSGATAGSYTPTAADMGFDLEVTITASNQTGSATATSPATSIVVGTGSFAAPTFLGPAVAGARITGEPSSTYTPIPASRTTYQFVLITPSGNSSIVQNGSNPTLAIPPSAVGDSVQITANTALFRTDGHPLVLPGNGREITTITTTPVITSPPVPTISGIPIAGSQYTATPGTWPADGNAPLAFHWQDCDAAGSRCASIAGATHPSYTTTASDVGHAIRVVVTAGIDANSVTSPSEPSPAILAAGAPQDTATPQINGQPAALQTLSVTPGAWSGDQPVSYTYQWQSCDSQGANCADIAGETSPTYTLQDSDVNDTIRVNVTATNGAGSITVTTATTPVIAPEPPPANTQLPSLKILGPSTDAATFITDGGQWSNLPAGSVPDALLYQWQSCNPSGAACSDIAGATAQDYDATAANDGQRIRVVVTGETDAGAAIAASPASAPLTPSTTTLIGKLVYDSGTGLYTANADGSNATRISDCTLLMLSALGSAFTGTNCSFSHPRISPNGQMVAVNVLSPGAACSTPCGSMLGLLYTMNYDGSAAQQLPFYGENPAWAPDGTAVLYTGLATGGGFQPVFSPGDPEVPNTQLFTAYLGDPADSSAPLPLPSGTVSADGGSYSSDGSYMAYSALDPSTLTWSVYTANSDGTSPTVLPSQVPGTHAQDPAFTPDGANIVYTAPVPDASVGLSFDGIYSQPVDPAGATLMTPATSSTDGQYAEYSNPSFGPDGTIYATSHTGVIALGTYGIEIGRSSPGACVITPPSTSCVRLPLPSPISDPTRGTGTGFGAGKPGGPASGFTEDTTRLRPPNGSSDGTPGVVLRYEPKLQLNGDDGFYPVAANWMTKFAAPLQTPATSQYCTGDPNSLAKASCGPATFPLPPSPKLNTANSWLEYPGLPAGHLGTNDPANAEGVTSYTLSVNRGSASQFDARQWYYFIVPLPGGGKLIEYWFYYTFNWWEPDGKPCGSIMGRGRVSCDGAPYDLHEGDWENIDVVVNANGQLVGTPGAASSAAWIDTSPDFIYFQHGIPWQSGGSIGNSDLRSVEVHGTHPLAFSALGDHADYPFTASQTGTRSDLVRAGLNVSPPWLSCDSGGVRLPTVPQGLGLLVDAFFGKPQDYPCDSATESGSVAPVVEQSLSASRMANLGSSALKRRFACWAGRFGGQPAPWVELGHKFAQSPSSPLQQQGLLPQGELRTAGQAAAQTACPPAIWGSGG